MLYVADTVFATHGAGSGMCSWYRGLFSLANNENRTTALGFAPRGRWRAPGLAFTRHVTAPDGQHRPITFKAAGQKPALLTILQAVNRAGTF